MNDDPSDLEQRLLRLRPAEVPGDLQRRLRVSEPSQPTPLLRWHTRAFFAAWLRPWPLAYAGLGVVWLVILGLHFSTQADPSAADFSVAQTSGDRPNAAPATLTAGFALDRAILLTRNNPSDSIWP